MPQLSRHNVQTYKEHFGININAKISLYIFTDRVVYCCSATGARVY